MCLNGSYLSLNDLKLIKNDDIKKITCVSYHAEPQPAEWNCSTPNLSPTPVELCQWTAFWGSIIIHNPTLSITRAIAIYSPGKQKKINYLASI